MMNKKILFWGAIVLVISLILFFYRPTASLRKVEEEPPQIEETGQSHWPTAQSNHIAQANAGTNVGNYSAESLGESPFASNGIDSRFLEKWQVPIEFYGKVVDESANPVSGAQIGFEWVETPSDDGTRSSSTESDINGIFSLHGKKGPSLIVTVSKNGYYSSQRGQRGFNYALGPDIHSPNPQNPVVFVLRKKGVAEPLIHIGGTGLRTMRDFLLDDTGKATEVSLRTGQVTTSSGGLRVELQTGELFNTSKSSWKCRVSIPGGGLRPTDEEFPFIAPETGYQAEDSWAIGPTNWTEQVEKQYYVKLGNGNFGRVRLRVIGVPHRAYFRMESFLNPTGSRNLEPLQ